MILQNIAVFFVFMTMVSSSPLSSERLDDLQADLTKVKEVRNLLENLLHKRNKEVNLNRRVGEVVEKVFFSRSLPDDDDDDDDDEGGPQSRAWKRPTEGDCENGERFTCKDNLCDPVNTKSCWALCDAFPLGPNRERYVCRCNPGGRGLYCNVTENGLCVKHCPNPNHCYEMNASLSGYFCYSPKWKLKNPEDIRERSVSEVEEMGSFARVVDTIMRRQLNNN